MVRSQGESAASYRGAGNAVKRQLRFDRTPRPGSRVLAGKLCESGYHVPPENRCRMEARVEKKRILLIDDSEIALLMEKATLEQMNPA
jgi:hypothetical protein